MGEGLTQPTDTQHTPIFDMPPPKPKKTQKPRQSKRKTTKVPQLSESTDIAADKAVYKVAVTVCSGDGPKRQNTMRDTSAHTRLKHIELMKIYTTLQKKVLELEDELKRTKTAQQTKIDGLERKVKKLEKKHMSRTHKLKRLYKVGHIARVISSSDDEALDKEDTYKQGRIDEVDADEDIALVSKHYDVSTQGNIVQDESIEDVGKEEVVEVVTTAKMLIDIVVDAAQVTTAIVDIPISVAEITTAPTITSKSTNTNVKVTQASKRKRVMIQDPEETTTTKTASLQQPQVQDKGKEKAKLIKEPKMPKKRKHQFRADEELDAKIKADYQLAQRLQAKEQEKLIDAEKAKLFMKVLEKRRKFFAAKRTKEKRNIPPTKAQQRSLINELVEESTKKDEAETVQESNSKRTGDDPEQERSKKQKMKDNKESAELK
nr:hypothetical protein [Tanacetum cinerariifolium]